MRPTFIVNGVDFARRINKFAYEVGYEKVLGRNSGTMKNGDYTEDLIRWNTVLKLSTNAMTAAEAKELLQALTNSSEVAIGYDDPRSGAVKQAWFNVKMGRNRVSHYENGALIWKEGVAITLTEARAYE